jgi:4-hydroxybenzoate polyprenyltransferase
VNRTPPEPPFWRTILELVRAPAIFTALSNVLAAHWIASGGTIQWRALVLTAGASVFLYAAGMVLNDCFDLAEDARERPRRPLPSGRVSPAAAWAGGWFLLASGVALAGLAGTRQIAVAAVLAVAIVLYDGALKSQPAGALAMGACRYLNWLLGFAIAPLAWHALLIALPVFIYVTALTRLSAIETSAARRQPVQECALGMLIAALTIGVLLASRVLPNPWAWLPLIAGLGAVLHRLARAGRELTPAAIQGGVGFLVLGIVPLDALLTLASGHAWGALAVLFLAVPSRLLARLIYVT